MALSIQINNSSGTSSDYVTWTPTPCRLVSNENSPRTVVLRNRNPLVGGQVVFYNSQRVLSGDSIQITIPAGGTANFYIAGKFDQATGRAYASKADKDTVISITEVNTNVSFGIKRLMVRVRKNANTLTTAERNRFLDALVRLNQAGGYVELQNMHVTAANREIHSRSCFLPWHRGFLLDLERKLQEINPAVTIPYWKFDDRAQNVFTRDFMGVPDATGLVDFSATNPLINWRLTLFGAGNGTRIRRVHSFNGTPWNPLIQRAIGVQRNESQTISLGSIFSAFSSLEGDPHGSAHVSFIGQVSSIGTAPADPLFFMLHANVDRLWAKWQFIRGRFNNGSTDSYPRQGNAPANVSGEFGVGNFANDTMWPWNDVITPPRPASAPGNRFPNSPIRNFPGTTPIVSQMIDYHGKINLNNDLCFAYDDVPY
jgi:tyrosinase